MMGNAPRDQANALRDLVLLYVKTCHDAAITTHSEDDTTLLDQAGHDPWGSKLGYSISNSTSSTLQLRDKTSKNSPKFTAFLQFIHVSSVGGVY